MRPRRRSTSCNSGVMCLDGALIAGLLGAIRNDNAKGEFYLTDAVAHRARRRPPRHRRRRDGGGVPGRQFARRAGGGRGGAAGAPARRARWTAASRWPIPTRSGCRPTRRLRARRHDRAERALRSRRDAWRRTSRSRPSATSRAPGSADGRHHRPVRPHPAGLGRRPRTPISAISSSSRPPAWARAPRPTISPISAIPTSARRSNIGAGTISVNYDGYGKWRTRDRRRCLRRLEQLAGRAGARSARAPTSPPAA